MSSNLTYNNKLNGINPLAYQGVNASTPPNCVVNTQRPTTNEWKGFQIGSIWVVTGIIQEIYMLIALDNQQATWVEIYPGNGLGLNFLTDSGTAAVLANTIQIVGGTGITTSGSGDTVTISFTGSSTAHSAWGTSGQSGQISSTSTSYVAPFSVAFSGVRANAEFISPVTGTLDKLYVYVSANASTINVTYTICINDVSSTVVATVTALATGIFSDTTHSVAVNAGDKVQIEISAGAVGVINGSISMRFVG